jgi:chromosome segregation ATPase
MGSYVSSRSEIEVLKTQIETLKIVNRECRRDIDCQQKEIAKLSLQREECLSRIRELERENTLQERRLAQLAQLINPLSSFFEEGTE